MLRRLLSDQRVVFVLAGGTNTVIGLLFFAAIYETAGGWLGYLGVLGTSYALAILTGFWLQWTFVFDSAHRTRTAFSRYVGVQLCALAGNAALLPLMVEVAGVPVLPGQIASLTLTTATTYFVHRRFTFGDSQGVSKLPNRLADPVADVSSGRQG